MSMLSEDCNKRLRPYHFSPSEFKGYLHATKSKKARTLNKILRGECLPVPNDPNLPITPATFRKYLTERDFCDALADIAPYMSQEALCGLHEIVTGQAEGTAKASDTRLKAILETLKAFAPRALDAREQIVFDAGVRRAKAEAKEQGKLIGLKEVMKALASDPFRDVGAEISAIRAEVDQEGAASTPGEEKSTPDEENTG